MQPWILMEKESWKMASSWSNLEYISYLRDLMSKEVIHENVEATLKGLFDISDYKHNIPELGHKCSNLQSN
jgi:hypothetical protein